ncbi:MAG: proprotein convertase P-domain-containing protein, partial [Xanthomonadales bacterium]|nr:proprotein convertase P-domain-containing protein [Xanthomonadales bacterium]
MDISSAVRRSVLMIFLLVGQPGFAQSRGVHYVYDFPAASLPIPVAAGVCPSGALATTIVVPESFSNADIAVGVEIQHANRGDLRVDLVYPDGSVRVLASPNLLDVNDHFNVTFADNPDGSVSPAPVGAGNGPVNDGDDDPSPNRLPYRRRVHVANINGYTGSVAGNWTLRVCDNVALNATGTLIRANLVLRDTTAAPAAEICDTRSAYNWATNGGAVPGVVFPPAGISINGVLMTEANSGESPVGGSVPSFRLRTDTLGVSGHYRYQTAPGATLDTQVDIEWTDLFFDAALTGLQITIYDLDVNSYYEDYGKIEGYGPGGERVPAHVSFPAGNLSFFGDWLESDTNVDNNSPGLGFATYRFLGPVVRVRSVFADGDNSQDATNHGIALGPPSFCAFDYGDAPTTYGTRRVDNGPRHSLVERNRLFIGNLAPDGEIDGVVSVDADSDDVGLNNDEDTSQISYGVRNGTNPDRFDCGAYQSDVGDYCLTVPVTNTTGTAAQLVGWLDFNGNGVFDADERSLPDLASTAGSFVDGNVPNGSSGLAAVLVFSPASVPNPQPDATQLRLRLSTDPSFFASPSHLGQVRDGEVEDHTVPEGTLPVTLAAFEAQRLDSRRLSVRWVTATEAGTVGYRLYQQFEGHRQLLTEELVVATGVDSLEPRSYQLDVQTDSDAPIVVEELSSYGKVERYGPYAVGRSLGGSVLPAPVNWAEVRLQRDLALVAENGDRLQRAASGGAAVEVLVDRDGLQRLPVADLIDVGLNPVGLDVRRLRLSRGGEPVPLRAIPGPVITAQSVLEFPGLAVQGSLYTQTQPYRLTVAADLQESWANVSAAPTDSGAAQRMLRQFALDQDRAYSFAAPRSDPWYFDTVQRGGTPSGKTWTLPLSDLGGGPATLHLDLYGGIAYPGDEPDHRYRILVNGQFIAERQFDGNRVDQSSHELPEGLLTEGNNTVRIELLATGNPADILRIESIAIEAASRVVAEASRSGLATGSIMALSDRIQAASFEDQPVAPLACGGGCAQLSIAGFVSDDVVAILRSSDGWMELTDLSLQTQGSARTVQLRLPSAVDGEGNVQHFHGQLFVTERELAAVPRVRPASTAPHPLAGGAADFVIIAPYRFFDEIQLLVQARQSEGLTVRAVNIAEIYDHYSGGVVTPAAIKSFIADAYSQLGSRYVLLAGGDSYDYFDRLGLGSVSDIPTFYGGTHEVVLHAPLDAPFADVDDDGAPDLALGRLLGRTDQEMSEQIAKILSHPNTNLQFKSVFAIDRSSPSAGEDFVAEVNEIISAMNPAWQANAAQVSLADYPAGVPGTDAARADLFDAINLGKAVVGYFGHGGPTLWSFDSLVHSSQINGLANNAGLTGVVTEYGCWGGYFAAPQFNTMSQGWLGAGERGAAAVMA